MTDRTPTVSTPECYCCTCSETEYGRLIWDSACRNHGAHGARACAKHDLPDEPCSCGACDGVIAPLSWRIPFQEPSVRQ